MFYFKITYPDNTIEFWNSSLPEFNTELKRLQNLHNNKIKFEIIG
jgi:hypothetical protein